MKLRSLKRFISEVEKKYGRSALGFRIEVHRPEYHQEEKFWIPYDLDSLSVATYAKDEENPKETVVVIR